jgi:outer membrane protein
MILSNIRPSGTKPGIMPCTLMSLLWMITTAFVAPAATADLSLADVARASLVSNLDLLSQRQSLKADKQAVELARSELLPHVGVGARAQILEDDRSDSSRGNNTQESVLLAAELSQVLYDEPSWASLGIQKFVYQSQAHELESFRLEVIREAAVAFLDLDLARSVLAIEERNRELTRKNLETSRSRIAAGWSSDRELLRWDVELASNDSDVRTAQVRTLQGGFELNRIRNIRPEDPITLTSATVQDYGFVYARKIVEGALSDPVMDQRIRDFMVRLGIHRSPDLAAIDASISALERQLKSSTRAFWVPTFTVGAGVDHLATDTEGGESVKETEYYAKGVVTFPLFQGGAKVAGYRQARDALTSLRTARRATAQALEQSIRSSVARASGSFENIGYARRELDAARQNFDLVDASFTLGVASILDVLDAQSQLLTAELSLTQATYGFLADVITVQRQVNFYAFLEQPSEVDGLVAGLESTLAPEPPSTPR